MLAERYRHVYLHDLRGGLQSLQNAVQLLARASLSPGQAGDMTARVAELANRSLSTHEQTIQATLDQLLLVDEPALACDLSEVVRQLLKFLQNEIAVNDLTIKFAPREGLHVRAAPNRLRLVIMALLTVGLDRLPRDTVWELRLFEDEGNARLDLGPTIIPDDLAHELNDAQPSLDDIEAFYHSGLSLRTVRQLLVAQGATIEVISDPGSRAAWRVRYPLA